MADITTDQVLELENLDPDAWNDYAMAQGWGDGFPLVMPTEAKGRGLHRDRARR